MPPKMKMALLSTPWPLFNRPSIQLGALKAFVTREVPTVKVDAYHLYLTIAETLGYDIYRAISERTWLSESCYAALLYPEREEDIRRFWRSRATGLARKWDLRDVCLPLKRKTDQMLAGIDWEAYFLVGLSMCLGQLTSAVYFAREIRRRAPDLRIVVGGSACSGEMGQSLLRAFPEIDFVISGEGERPLVRLVRRLLQGPDSRESGPIPGLIAPNQDSRGPGEDFDQVSDLDQLPVPDYRDYFTDLNRLSPERRFFPALPVEMSRGCWWRKTVPDGRHTGCAFCNLNVQWTGYRTKSQERVLAELETLSARHEVLSLSFMDNLLPPKDLEVLFQRIAHLGKDFHLFAEIRASTPLNELIALGKAGVEEVQVGIEALSSRLLKKLNKGTTAIENLEMMKNCETPNLPDLAANLLLDFPGSDRTDVAETLASLEFALPFRPLKPAPFWLGYGSPVSIDPKAFGLKGVRNHPYYARLFPPEILEKLTLMIQGYQGGLRRQRRLWRPVKQAVAGWKKAYLSLHESPRSGPILSYQDGGHFLIIRQRRLGQDDMTHRLKGTSRKIYLFCQKNHSVSDILRHFPGLGKEKALPFLNMMVGKKLMFKEGARYLSLAVPVRGYGRAALEPQNNE